MAYYVYKMIHLPTGRLYIGQHKIPAAAHKGKPWSEARRAAWLNSKRKEVA